MDDQEKTDDEILQELHTKHPIDELVKFSEYNIQEKLEQNTYQIIKFKELFIKEKNNLDKMISLKERIIGERFDFYRFHSDKDLRPNEIIQYYLPKDLKIIQINKLIRKQQLVVSFFEMCVDAISRLGWAMKSWLDSNRMGL